MDAEPKTPDCNERAHRLSMQRVVIWLARLLHMHSWECVGRYGNGPDKDGYYRTTFQFRCRGCGEWKNETS